MGCDLVARNNYLAERTQVFWPPLHKAATRCATLTKLQSKLYQPNDITIWTYFAIFMALIVVNVFVVFRKKDDHYIKLNNDYWKDELKKDKDGFSKFQLNLSKRLTATLKLNDKKYVETIENIGGDSTTTPLRKVIQIALLKKNDFDKLTEWKTSEDSIFWISDNMAEYKLKSAEHVYEKWGYLKPEGLIERYIESVEEILGLEILTSHNRR